VTRSPRFKQDAVIGMAILVVILALWRLHSRPEFFGGLGPWAETNIFGASTLSLIPRPGVRAGGEVQPLNPQTASSSSSNQSELVGTNSPSSLGSPATGTSDHPSSNGQTSPNLMSINNLNTNGPVTVIAVPPADLMETPPGVSASLTAPEAAAMDRRLGEVSAKGGDIQISLSWHNYNDLDLHCVDPGGEEIFFSNRKSSRTGGELDIDQNAHMPYNLSPVENIYWPFGGAPPGLYRIFVVYYAQHGGADSTPFLVRTVVQGRTNFFRSTISYTGVKEKKLICNLSYDPANANPSRRFRFIP
jgi:hypothetical protein